MTGSNKSFRQRGEEQSPSDRSAALSKIGYRARAKAQTRSKILSSAAKQFGMYGFETAKLRDIAKDAGVSTGAIFANFADKAEIFRAVLKTERTKILTDMRARNPDHFGLSNQLHFQMMRGFDSSTHNARILLSAWSMDLYEPASTGALTFLEEFRLTLLETIETDFSGKGRAITGEVHCAADMLADLWYANLRRATEDGCVGSRRELIRVSKTLRDQLELIVKGLQN